MFGDESTDNNALDRVDEWEHSMAQHAAQIQALTSRAAELSATARSHDSLVEVSIGMEGQLTRLHLDERIRQQPADTTARSIMQALRAAKEDLLRQFETATAETVGSETETGRMLIESQRRWLAPPMDPSGDQR
ncbi:YbaB/EbfC family nucleoid-associated protein [Actinoplanes sp. CA-054009]